MRRAPSGGFVGRDPSLTRGCAAEVLRVSAIEGAGMGAATWEDMRALVLAPSSANAIMTVRMRIAWSNPHSSLGSGDHAYVFTHEENSETILGTFLSAQK